MREQVLTRDVIANPKTKYGNARSATRYFIAQRLSGASNIVFLGFLLFIVLRLASHDRADVVATLGNGWIGLPFAVLLVVVCVHMRIGMREIIEDYIHDAALTRLTMALNSFFVIVVGIAGVVSLFKLVFWG